MTRLFLSIIALALAASARADVSDSGSLTIGGQGVIQGTMTVQGSAFSVGGTTFSVAGGSVTLGGQLNVSAAGIKWADGTVSVSSSGGGVGNVVLTATQTFSGANTFTSSITVGPSVYGATITANSVVVNGWTTVANTSFSAATDVWIYGFRSSATYVVHIELVPTAVSVLTMKVNNTSGVNDYSYYNNCWNTASGPISISGQATNPIRLIGSNYLARYADNGAATGYIGQFTMGVVPGGTMIYAYGQSSYIGSADADLTNCITGWVPGRITLTWPLNLRFTISTGTVRGRIWVEQMTLPQAY